MISSKTSIFEKTLHRLGSYLVKLYSFFVYDIDITHISTIPDGPKIFIANHPNTLDPIILFAMCQGKTNVLVHGNLFNIPIFGAYLRKSGHIPVDPDSGQQIIDLAVKRLKKGENILIFIEGGLSPSLGGFRSPKTGAARIALLSGAPIIPVGVGIFRQKIKRFRTVVNHEVALVYPYGQISFTFGKPINLSGDIQDFSYVQQQSQLLMSQIRQLSYLSLERLTS